MPIQLVPWQRPCDCRCPRHHQQIRAIYDEPDCACATQPVTLVADRWHCALFLDQRGDLWHVPTGEHHGTWDWDNAAAIDTRHDYYHASEAIKHLLHASTYLIANPDA